MGRPWTSIYFLQSQNENVIFLAVRLNLLVAAEAVGGDTGVVPEVVVLDVSESEAVLTPGLLHHHLRPGTELPLLEEPGGAGLGLPGHQAVDDDGAAGAAGDALSLHRDDRAVCREDRMLLTG